MHLFYYLATFATRVLLVTLTRWEVTGRQHVPRRGGLILISNHLNNVDPPILSASLPRRIIFMAKEEVYHSRGIMGVLTRAFGAFPIRRGEVDRRALRQAFRALEQGMALGMFPEGRRSPTGRLQPAQMGTAWIALESGAPILPVAIWGTEGIHRLGDILARPRIRVNIGKPFSLPSSPLEKRSARLAQATQTIMEAIAALLPPQYLGAYSSQEAARWR